MNITINTSGIEITGAIRDYAEKKIESLSKFIRTDSNNIIANIELGQSTKHHKSGNIFRAEINISFVGKKFRAVSEKEDLYASIDEARDSIERELVSHKDKAQTLFRRGATSVKKLLKGLSRRKP